MMCEPPDTTAEEILRSMIRDRIGSADPGDIRQAEEFRQLMDGLSAIQHAIDLLDEALRGADDPGQPGKPPELIAQLRDLRTTCAELKATLEALIVDPWKEGYMRGYERGWADSAAGRAAREQALATVIDLTSRLPG